MTKRHPQIDNAFSPSLPSDGSLFTIVFSAVALALGAGVMALLRVAGRL